MNISNSIYVHPNSKLTIQQIEEMKDLYHNTRISEQDLADKFSISLMTLRKYCRGRKLKSNQKNNLTEEQLADIEQRLDMNKNTIKELANEYNVSYHYLYIRFSKYSKRDTFTLKEIQQIKIFFNEPHNWTYKELADEYKCSTTKIALAMEDLRVTTTTKFDEAGNIINPKKL